MAMKTLTHKRIEATAALIQNDKNDKTKRIDLTDARSPGLVFRATKTGRQSFSFRYSWKGKSKRFKIGDYPGVSLDQARKRALELKLMVEGGKDPQYEKHLDKKSEDPLTVEEVAGEFIRQHVSKLRPSTQVDYKNRIKKHIIPEFGVFRLEDLTRRMIREYLEELVYEDDQHVNANRIRAILSSMVSFAMQKDLIDYNIVKTVKPVGKETSRDRVYSVKEIQALWEAFGNHGEPVGSLLKILLLTGQRLGETRRMRWDQIQGKTWTIPSDQTKADRTHHIPLSETALKIIQDLKPLTGGSEWVFESFYNPGAALRYIYSTTAAIQDETKIKDFKPHDLRRTMASNLAGLGTDRTVLGKVLNHKGLSGDSAITAVYDRHDYMKEKRIALAKWDRLLLEIVTGEKQENVIKMGA